MRREKKWRYYCDFCKKSGGSGGHMKKHEKHCTMNPDRVCSMCEYIGMSEQKPIAELVAVVPNWEDYAVEEEDWVNHSTYISLNSKWEPAINEAVKKLRELTCDCPACILAALRQSVSNMNFVPYATFNFSAEMKERLKDCSEDHSINACYP